MGNNSSLWTKFDLLTTIIFWIYNFKEFGHNTICLKLISVTLVTPKIKKSLDFLSNFNFLTKKLKRFAKYG